MTQSKPGALSTLAAIIGILGYLIADMFAFASQDAFAANSQTIGEAAGNILAGAIIFVVAFMFEIGGLLFSLLGQIWKQNKILVVISLLAFIPIFLPFGNFTVAAFSTGMDTNSLVTFIVSWAILLGVLFLHIKGLRE